MAGGATAVAEPLGASTMPQSVLPPASQDGNRDGDSRSPDLDLDLDLDVFSNPTSTSKVLDDTQPIDVAATAPAYAPSNTPAAALDFGSISLDLGTSGRSIGTEPALDYSSMPGAFDGPIEALGDPADPLVRKLELAEEFRQIGDKDGARDLLEEVVAKASGPLKARAQGLLDGLA